MAEETGQKFEMLYPKSLSDETACYRIIVSGELARYDFWGLNTPREGIFSQDEQGARMIYGFGKLVLLSRTFMIQLKVID